MDERPAFYKLKYVLHIFIFMMLYVFFMFLIPSLTMSRIRICASLYVVTAAEYVYLWFVRKGYFFSVPLSFLPIMAMGAFYFNQPDNPDMGLGMWVLFRYLVMPQLIASCAVSAVMHVIKRNGG